MNKPVVLTGLRANAEFHIGNYLGGILPVIGLQTRHAGEYQVNMFIPDLHSFTTPIDHSKLYDQTVQNLKVFVAAGLDINNPDTFIYRQSFVPAHSELTWILDCFTGMGELTRMTQFKDRTKNKDYEEVLDYFFREWAKKIENAVKLLQENDKDGALWAMHEGVKDAGQIFATKDRQDTAQKDARVGLFNYPVLMAADILLYDAKFVPVGDDQKQHLELTRDLAIRMNNKFEKELFIVPEAWNKQLAFMNLESGARIRSLRNPEKKMSKSVTDPSGTIMLSDDPGDAAKKIMRAETDSFGVIKYDFAERPGVSNLLQMLALLTGRTQADVNADWEGKERYGDLKKEVAEATEAFLIHIQQKINEVDEAALMQKLEQDEAAMNEVANTKLLEVQKAVGLRK